jgi:hypothetical protein
MGKSVGQASLFSVAILFRYFVIIDVLRGIFEKLNVELGPKLDKIVTYLDSLQLPELSFVKISSPLDDGGSEATETWNESKKEESEKEKEGKGRVLSKSFEAGYPLQQIKDDLPSLPAEFFKFVEYRRNTRAKLITSN